MKKVTIDLKKKEVNKMKKSLVILMALAMLFAMTGLALAVQNNTADGNGTDTTGGYTTKGNIIANQYDLSGNTWTEGGDSFRLNPKGTKSWVMKEQGKTVTYSGVPVGGISGVQTYDGYDPDSNGSIISTHVYGTWNSPYTYGIDGYNYNDAQDYTDNGGQVGGVRDPSDTNSQHVYYPLNAVMGNQLSTLLPGMFVNVVTIPGTTTVGDPNFNPYAGEQGVETTLTSTFTSGPHGGYLTSTHRCRECHAVHRAAGKFKLLRSDTRFEACDWCHGTGAGSGYNIQMDNDDAYTTEYNTGHTMGFGIQSGKWKAPDDTYPAFTPNYWMGGFSCFDCHSPHANPARIMGYDKNGKPIQSIIKLQTGEVYNMGNPGHDLGDAGGENFADALSGDGVYWVPALGGPLPSKSKPYYLAGSWLLIKNPDREIAETTETNLRPNVFQTLGMDPSMNVESATTYTVDGFYIGGRDSGMYWGPLVQDGAATTITAGDEILDTYDQALNEFDTNKAYPVNKQPTDWNNPIGSASIQDFTNMFGFAKPSANYGYNVRNPFCKSLILDEFCTDCHDGNGGLHTVQAPLFSEDRALREQTQTSARDENNEATNTVYSGNSRPGNTADFKGSYDLAYGHDAAVRH